MFPDSNLETAIRQTGGELLSRMSAESRAGFPLSRQAIFSRLMEWSMRDPQFKTGLFRFVDLLPSLRSGTEIVAHLREYLVTESDPPPWIAPLLRLGALAPAIAGPIIRAQLSAMARQFVAGEDAGDVPALLRRNEARGIATTLDLLGEAVVSEAEADHFLHRNLEVLSAAGGAGGDPRFPRLNLSLKISALAPGIDPAAPDAAIAAIKKRLRPLLRAAKEAGAFINFDMESYRLKGVTLALFRSILEEGEFHAGPAAGIALQAYLRDCEDDLRDLIDWARRKGRTIGVRLVKGAYWDQEVITARQQNWPVPVWLEKAQSDANFEKLSLLLLEHRDAVIPIFATHNIRSTAHAIAQAARLGVPPGAFEFQALYGMADDLKIALAQAGHRVREYCPIGELLPGMAYLVRRLLENTSNEGFLRARRGGESRETLLRNPVEQIAPAPPAEPSREFVNAANTDFALSENREATQRALASIKTHFGQKWPLVIGGRRVAPARFEPSINPARPDEIVGYWARASVADAKAAVAAARKAQRRWGETPAQERAALLERVADQMETERGELSALELCEAGKPWVEADADVSEAIDFCRFYAAEMRRLASGPITQPTPGEENRLFYHPRGVGVIVAPWNFPLAILCGMAVAAIVTGNTVILKPAEQTSILGAVFMRILEEAGLPDGVANLLTGEGEEIGPVLVEHPEVDFIAFTGSRTVGTEIWERAGRTQPGQVNLKKVVCEMGGKNALIIDNSADLDEAIPAALASAFSYSGQKCSALSRLIVLDEVYERFVPRFIAAAATVPVGDPALPGTVVGPVIDEEARTKILTMIERGKREAHLAWQGTTPEGSRGTFVPPTVFTGVHPDAAIAREEIFGPVVAVLRAHDLNDALAIANGVPYALTGGLFSRTPSSLERARREFLVGNLYLNRGITGAIVERHPFGGFKMSGGGTKAGGTGYLENFLFPRVISENSVRRGFTPPASSGGAPR